MSSEEKPKQISASRSGALRLSLDWWAVITALVLILLVLSGILSSVPW
jgi:hypothetical protein